MRKQQLSSLQVRIRASTLGARIHLQERTAVRMRAMCNNALLHYHDEQAEIYERSALYAERKAAALFKELLDLTEAYIVNGEVMPPCA